MKLTVIGGCGVRAPQLVNSAIHRQAQNELTELWLMDIDETRLHLIGGLCQQISTLAESPVRIVCTSDARAALDGASYILSTIRVGGDYGRVLDEKIALRHGVLGQETTGAGGFAMAMRSIPALLEYAEMAEKYAPGAWLFNFTNPAGLVTQALHERGFVRSVGICDSANHAQNDASHWLGIPPTQVKAEVFGLNHLSWARKLWVDGRDVLPGLLENPAFCAESHLKIFDPALLDLLGLFLNEYLYYYYYAEQAFDLILHDQKTRGEEILELNQVLFKQLAEINIQDNPQAALTAYISYEKRRSSTYMHYAVPGSPSLEQADQMISAGGLEIPGDDEGYAGLTLDIITALQTGSVLDTALNIPNRGAIDGLADADVVEVSARIAGSTINPVHIGNIPSQPAQLMYSVKEFERLAVAAILNRSTRLAVQALMSHPLVLSYSRATKLTDEYLKAHAAFIGEWK